MGQDEAVKACAEVQEMLLELRDPLLSSDDADAKTMAELFYRMAVKLGRIALYIAPTAPRREPETPSQWGTA